MNQKINKSICFIAAGLLGGGIERAYTSLANHFAKIGYDVSVITLFQSEHFFQLHSSIKLIEPTLDRKKHNKYLYALKLMPYLRKHLKNINPEVVLSYGEYFNPYVILATRGLGIKLFVCDRMGPDLKLGGFQDSAKKLLYRFATGVFAQTNYAAQKIQQNTGVTNICVVPNPLNLINCPDLPKKNQIVSVGRLSREKGHRFLIEAFSKAGEENWTLHFVGDGLERKNLEEQVQNLNVSERVIFHGHLKNFESILAESKIFVLPSLYEGFPNALMEAMSVPLACISTDCNAGPRDIITHGVNGLLCPTGESIGLGKQLNRLIKDETLRSNLAQSAYKIRDTFKFEKIANQYLDFIFQNKNQE